MKGTVAAMLIDADNLAPAALEEAFAWLSREGLRTGLLRAYGGHDKLAGMRDCLLRHGVRAVVNHGKGTTDVLLAVDAMDLLHAQRLPLVVAIASSDADFAPLALRLREAGHKVLCFAQAGKAADGDLARCYDERIYVYAESAPAPPEEKPPAPARKEASRKTAAKAAAKPAAPQPADPVRQVLDAVEGFRQGRSVELNEVVKRLRDQKLLGKSASGATFLKKHAPYLELSPAQQPNKLRLKAHAG